MEFSEKAIDDFIAIYEDNFKESISRADAVEMAKRLVNMYRLFLRPRPPAVEAAMKEREARDLSSTQAS